MDGDFTVKRLPVNVYADSIGRECYDVNVNAAIIDLFRQKALYPYDIEAAIVAPYVSRVIGSGGGMPSGAMIEGQPFSTTVGGYTVELTSNGGFSVHGSGASVTLSGGAVAASAAQGIAARYYNEDLGDSAHISMGYGGLALEHAGMGGSASLYLNDGGIMVNGDISGFNGLIVDGSAFTQASSAFGGTSLGIGTLEGGVKYVCSSALSALSIGSAAAGCNGTVLFTVASGAVVTPPANVPYFGVTSYTAGSSYLMMINDTAAVCNEAALTPGV